MINPRFKTAAVQMKCILGEPETNLLKAEEYLQKAAKAGAKFVCLPELFDSGYDLAWIKKNARYQSKETISFLSVLARELKIYIVAGIANERRGLFFNSSCIFSPSGRRAGLYDKNHLFPLTHEEKYFQRGRGSRIVKTDLCTVGMSVCFDLRFPSPFQQQARQGATIIFVNAAWGLKRLKDWCLLLKTRALENQLYIVASAQMGKPGKMAFAGHSAIVDFDGRVIVEKKKGEGVIIATLDMSKLKKRRTDFPIITKHSPVG